MKSEITVDGVTYRRVDDSGERLRIVVVDNRGMTFVGRCDLGGDEEQIIIHGARCIIRWGTDQHLSQLADGPLPNTVLGAARDVVVFRHNLILAYDVAEEAWA